MTELSFRVGMRTETNGVWLVPGMVERRGKTSALIIAINAMRIRRKVTKPKKRSTLFPDQPFTQTRLFIKILAVLPDNNEELGYANNPDNSPCPR
jgi:hypothetical protein